MFKIRDRPFGFLLGAGAGFFQQLKLDTFRDFSESIYLFTHKVIFTIAKSAYTLEHQLSTYPISNLQFFLLKMANCPKR